MTQVTRRYRFSASHRLHASSLNEEQNRELYGKCNNPYGHGHDYILEVTYTGSIDPRTGLVAPVPEIDAVVQQHILHRFSARNLNLDVPEFANELVPTTENIAAVIRRDLEQHWPDASRLRRVHVQETDRNGFTIFAEDTHENRFHV